MINIEGVQSGREHKGEWGREREQERVRESVPNKGKQSVPLRTIVTLKVQLSPVFFPFSEKVRPELVTKYPAGARTELKPVVTSHKVRILTHDQL